MSSNIQNQRLRAALTRLDELTNWERRPRGAMFVDLEPIRDLAHRLGEPHNSFRSVHVAGTKGKGSTCSLIATALSNAGIKVGRYGSPHLVHITERITLNGKPVDEGRLADAIFEALRVFQDAHSEGTRGQDATWFDLLTVSAFLVFRSEDVEWAIIEAGLGGRLDSTNIVPSAVAIITNIELEHTEVLGSTRAAIALEKAGIIKAGATVITPLSEDDEAGSVIAMRARQLGCDVKRPRIAEDATIELRNVALSEVALDAIGDIQSHTSSVSASAIGASLLNQQTIIAARLPGRMDMQKISVKTPSGEAKVKVVFDGAHVPFNLRAVLSDLSRRAEIQGQCFVVMSIAEDKDAVGLISTMNPANFSITFTTAGPRSRNPDQLKQLAAAAGYRSTAIDDPNNAYKDALQSAAAWNGWVLVTGSLYLVGSLMQS